MNKDIIKGKWEQLKGKAKEKVGRADKRRFGHHRRQARSVG